MKSIFKIVLLLILIKFAFNLPLNINIKPIPFGIDMRFKELMIKSKKGKILLKNENLKIRYLITGLDKNTKNKDDLIFYLHGAGRSEKQWIDRNGFGKEFYKALESNSKFDSIPVISISFGMSYFVIDNVPYPYEADLEKIFIEKIIPYFQNKLNRKGKIYLIGHSMGGFSALTLSLKYSDKIPIVLVISPFVSPHSPFTNDFIQKNVQLKEKKYWSKALKAMLIYLFNNEERWNYNDPFFLIKSENNISKPYIILTQSTDDMDGFGYTIPRFISILNKRNHPHFYYITSGDHHKPETSFVFYYFLNKIHEYKHK